MGGLSSGRSPDAQVLLTFKPGSRKFPVQLAAKRLEIDYNVIRTHLRTPGLALNFEVMQ